MEVIDWALRVVMVVVSIGVFAWGRSQKQSDDLLAEKTADLRRHLRDGFLAQDKTLLLQLQVRDQQLLAIHGRLDAAGQKASDVADKVQAKMTDLDHRLVVLESRLARMSP